MAIFKAAEAGTIVHLGPYQPWGLHKSIGGSSINYPSHSARILDFKKGGILVGHDVKIETPSK